MAQEPIPGQVIKFDFLWDEEAKEGQELGSKDRPCAIIMASKPQPDGSQIVRLCGITHSPPTGKETGIKIPPRVAQKLGLDTEQSWIKTHQLNEVVWPKDALPHGMTKAPNGQWIYGSLPKPISQAAFAQIREHNKSRSLRNVQRDKADVRKFVDRLKNPPKGRGDRER